jgi:hypothetical protein
LQGLKIWGGRVITWGPKYGLPPSNMPDFKECFFFLF